MALLPVLSAALLLLLPCGADGVVFGGVVVTAITPEGYRTLAELDRSAGITAAGSNASVGDVVFVTGDWEPETGLFYVRRERVVGQGDITPVFIPAERLSSYSGPDITALKVTTYCPEDRLCAQTVVPYRLGGVYHFTVVSTGSCSCASYSLACSVPSAAAPAFFPESVRKPSSVRAATTFTLDVFGAFPWDMLAREPLLLPFVEIFGPSESACSPD